MKHAIVEQDPNLVRDLHSKAILNTDSVGLAAYKKRKRLVEQQRNSAEQLNDRLTRLEQKMDQFLDALGVKR